MKLSWKVGDDCAYSRFLHDRDGWHIYGVVGHLDARQECGQMRYGHALVTRQRRSDRACIEVGEMRGEIIAMSFV